MTKTCSKFEEQVVNLGKILKRKNFYPTIAYTTEMVRAEHAAKIAMQEINHFPEIKKDNRIIEQPVGKLTGTPKTPEDKKIVKGRSTRPEPMDLDRPFHFANNSATLGNKPSGFGAESREDVMRRAQDFYNQELRKKLENGHDILVVVHSKSLKALITVISGQQKDDLEINNVEPLELRFFRDEKGQAVFWEIVKIPHTELLHLTNLKPSLPRHLKHQIFDKQFPDNL